MALANADAADSRDGYFLAVRHFYPGKDPAELWALEETRQEGGGGPLLKARLLESETLREVLPNRSVYEILKGRRTISYTTYTMCAIVVDGTNVCYVESDKDAMHVLRTVRPKTARPEQIVGLVMAFAELRGYKLLLWGDMADVSFPLGQRGPGAELVLQRRRRGEWVVRCTFYTQLAHMEYKLEFSDDDEWSAKCLDVERVRDPH
jgi:hypothetical protein